MTTHLPPSSPAGVEGDRPVITACDLGDADLAAARARARHAVAGLTGGAALTIQAQTYELIVINPRELSAGTLHVDYVSGLACWEHTVWDDLGHLPGYPTGGHARHLTPEAIRAALNAPLLHQPGPRTG